MTEETIFITALEKPTEAERAAFLADACAGDERLRRRVEALLRAHAESDDVLDPTGDRPELAGAREPVDEPAPHTQRLGDCVANQDAFASSLDEKNPLGQGPRSATDHGAAIAPSGLGPPPKSDSFTDPEAGRGS